jgi:ElaA protein
MTDDAHPVHPGPPTLLTPGSALVSSLVWTDAHHSELTASVLHDILELRNRVFVVEQKCCYQDIDGLDLTHDTRHLFAAQNDQLVAYARLVAPDDAGSVRIGRVIVSASLRGQRLGHELMTRALSACASHWPGAPVTLAAQAHLMDFYVGLGFVAVSEPYEEDGIPHVDMVLSPAAPSA